ncbi:hypothetical protein PR048_028299 [Dryococelus australis]|uniref:Uncharacterized protein n=1 Tax=Dryococelus australis TaxID=614101 RepID=A0ABQ9GIY4_9NEOP|nr:hypothetical protein PR048_028299 [Dryococelus australis]
MLRKVTECKIPLSVALLDYMNTPIAGIGFSPAQMYLHRYLKSKIPTQSDLLKPHVHANVPARLRALKHSQKCYYDRSTVALPELSPNQSVSVQQGSKWTPATIISKFDAPRSYLLKMLDGTPSCSVSELQENSNCITTMIDSGSAPNNVCGERRDDLRTSRVNKRPKYLQDFVS